MRWGETGEYERKATCCSLTTAHRMHTIVYLPRHVPELKRVVENRLFQCLDPVSQDPLSQLVTRPCPDEKVRAEMVQGLEEDGHDDVEAGRRVYDTDDARKDELGKDSGTWKDGGVSEGG